MIYVGIDIAKFNHFAAAITAEGEVLIEPFKFTNDADGFHLLSNKLNSLKSDNLIIGLESTAHYGDNLVRYLVNDGRKVCVINPIHTSAMRKANIRNTKTDKVDTIAIANTLIQMRSRRYVTFDDPDLMDLKSLGRFRMKSIKQRSRLKIQLKAHVDETFPELQYFFKSGLHQKAVYALLKEAPSAQDVGSMHLTHIANLLMSNSHGHFKKDQAIELRALARNTVGSTDSAVSIQIVQMIEQIELLDSQIDHVDCKYNVVKNNSTFKTYYDAKIAESLSHYNVLGHCADKLVRIIYKMLSDNVEFDLD